MAFIFDGQDYRYRQLFDSLEGEEVGIEYNDASGRKRSVDARVGRTTRSSFELVLERPRRGHQGDVELVVYDDIISLYVYAD